MPVAEGYIHADTPHAKTIAGEGWRYGCHSDKVGDHPRGRDYETAVQDGWTEDGRRVMRMHVSTWIAMRCGHDLRVSDPACTGCANRCDE